MRQQFPTDPFQVRKHLLNLGIQDILEIGIKLASRMWKSTERKSSDENNEQKKIQSDNSLDHHNDYGWFIWNSDSQ